MRREKQYRHGLAVPYRPIIAFCRKSDPLQGRLKMREWKMRVQTAGVIYFVWYFKVFSVVFHAVSPVKPTFLMGIFTHFRLVPVGLCSAVLNV